MSLKYLQGFFIPKHPEKYIGSGKIFYRSSWEYTFMKFCDNNPAVLHWASESVSIPYRNPLTGKNSVYIPDFLIIYIDKDQKKHAELIEIKPKNQTLKEHVGKNVYNQAHLVMNFAKWEAARVFCKDKGLSFRIINESDMFHMGSKKPKIKKKGAR